MDNLLQILQTALANGHGAYLLKSWSKVIQSKYSEVKIHPDYAAAETSVLKLRCAY